MKKEGYAVQFGCSLWAKRWKRIGFLNPNPAPFAKGGG